MEAPRERWSDVEKRFIICYTIFLSMYALLVCVIPSL